MALIKKGLGPKDIQDFFVKKSNIGQLNNMYRYKTLKSLRPYSAAERYEKVNVGMGYSLMTP